MRKVDLRFDYIISGGDCTRGGSVMAETRADAAAQVTRLLREGEHIWELSIRPR